MKEKCQGGNTKILMITDKNQEEKDGKKDIMKKKTIFTNHLEEWHLLNRGLMITNHLKEEGLITMNQHQEEEENHLEKEEDHQ
jgi:hypothetical protein